MFRAQADDITENDFPKSEFEDARGMNPVYPGGDPSMNVEFRVIGLSATHCPSLCPV
jgi:hypothetical protein